MLQHVFTPALDRCDANRNLYRQALLRGGNIVQGLLRARDSARAIVATPFISQAVFSRACAAAQVLQPMKRKHIGGRE